ncbi:hypothetical protein SNK03_011808 [Fusarium graminearum]
MLGSSMASSFCTSDHEHEGPWRFWRAYSKGRSQLNPPTTPKLTFLKLITASVLGVVCAGVRIIFTILARTRMVYGLHPRGSSFLMTLSCVFLPEALATLAFVIIGMMTRGIGG